MSLWNFTIYRSGFDPILTGGILIARNNKPKKLITKGPKYG